jgi:hypothetical protein
LTIVEKIAMKRVVILLFVALMSAGMAQALKYEKVDKVPVETYITDIKFDAKTNILSFTDNYKQGSLYDRKYIIYFYEWIESGSHETAIYKVTNSDKESLYIYGYPIMKTASEIACISITDIRHSGHRVEKEADAVNSIGGAYNVDISNEIKKVIEKSKYKLHIVVSVMVNENGYFISPETGKGINEGKETFVKFTLFGDDASKKLVEDMAIIAQNSDIYYERINDNSFKIKAKEGKDVVKIVDALTDLINGIDDDKKEDYAEQIEKLQNAISKLQDAVKKEETSDDDKKEEE